MSRRAFFKENIKNLTVQKHLTGTVLFLFVIFSVFSTTLDCIIVLVVESIHLNCFIYFHFFIKIPEVSGLFALYLSVFVLIKKCINFIVIFIYITFC